MFKPAKIECLPKMNFRYRLLKVENEWYLMEVDRPNYNKLFSSMVYLFCPS